MSYSESGLDSNFAINSASNFVPTFYESKSESDESESDFSSVFMNLGICIFSFLYLHSSKKIFGWLFLSIFKIESIVMQVMQV